MRTIEQRLTAFALGYPGAEESFPWGERAVKVRGKTFLFMRADASHLSLSVKLPHAREFALDYPFTEPTGYGLGRSGWVTARFGPGAEIPVDVLCAWIDESFRAIAPKRLVAGLPNLDRTALPTA
jgi:predicted DNA-binding protein (MmcQ/YjbR family)